MSWLALRGVSADCLADRFETSAENVRVQIHRFRKRPPASDWFAPVVPHTDLEYDPGLHGEVLGMRIYDDFTGAEENPHGIDDLEHRIRSEVASYADRYQFLNGARALLRIRRAFGHTSDAHRIALRALLHEKTAWFLVHSGFGASAVSEATSALWFYQFAFKEKSDHQYLDGYVRSALIASHANLLARRPQAALAILQMADAAAEHGGARLGSDHFRQRGVALFQMGQTYDETARRHFQDSASVMERHGEATSKAQVLMTGSRHIHLLGSPNWEGAHSVLDICSGVFSADSLEMSMNRHWAAACGLSTDSSDIHTEALKLLTANHVARRFGHQATIHKLLSVTLELDLDTRLRRSWVRWLLYENSFRSE